MSWVLITPTDVWMFRDGRPFVAGEGHTVSTVFPPTPFTVQGALRSLILGHEAVDWPDFWGQTTSAAQAVGKKIGHPAHEKNGQDVPAQLGAFSMRGPFLGHWMPEEGRAELLVQRPLDSYQAKDSQNMWHALQPHRLPPGWTDWPENGGQLYPLVASQETEKAKEAEHPYLLPTSGLMHYLQEQPYQLTNEAAFESERRLGIALNYVQRQPKDRMIYSLDYKRPFVKKVGQDSEPGILVKLGNDVTLPQKEGVLAIGGEARAAHYRLLNAAEAPQLSPAQPNQRLKVLLLTPSWFTDGWQPANGDWAALLGHPSGLRLVAAAIGRAHPIGGWRVPRQKGKVKNVKPMYLFLPAGSVFFFEADTPIQPVDTLTESPPEGLDLAKQGFGACVCGTWSWLKNA